MDIGIIGAGNIGATAARLFARAGHRVAISNSRGPESVGDLDPGIRATTAEDAAAFGEIVLIAIPYKAYPTLPTAQLEGKIVIDAMNYYPPRDGVIDFGDGTSSERVAQHLPGARVVKTFNTMDSGTLARGGRPDAPIDGRLVLFLAGDDAEAKKIVSHLIEEIGFAPLETGMLRVGGKAQQPESPIYGRPMDPAAARAALDTPR